MKTSSDSFLRRDLLKLLCVLVALTGTGALFLLTPTLSTPTLLSIVVMMLLAPLVTAFERRGYPRALSILFIFVLFGGLLSVGGFFALQSSQQEWLVFREKAPQYFENTTDRLRTIETDLKQRLPFLKDAQPTDALVAWGKNTGMWFVHHGASIMGNLLTCLFLVPILSFVLLHDGRAIERRFFHLVPNRFFESAFLVTHKIGTAISDYVRAKLLEAFLVGLLTTLGLALVQSPYALVLGLLAGVTNVIPYLGPIIGAIPGIAIAAFDSTQSGILWPVILVYVTANMIDMVLIFPIVVAKLVNLHPLLLIAVVALGQEYYGLVGMLISVPIAAALQVILQEVYIAVYSQTAPRSVALKQPSVPTDS